MTSTGTISSIINSVGSCYFWFMSGALVQTMVQLLKLPAWKVGDRRFRAPLWPSKFQWNKMFLLRSLVKNIYCHTVGNLRDREVACSASDCQGSNFESCVWRAVSSHSSHYIEEVLLARCSLYVHKGSLKKHSFYFHFCHTLCLLLAATWDRSFVLAVTVQCECNCKAPCLTLSVQGLAITRKGDTIQSPGGRGGRVELFLN